MDSRTKNFLSSKVTTDISRNLIRNLGGKYMKEAPDKINEQDWVGLSTMLINIRKDLSTMIDMVLANEEGGLAYLCGLTVLIDNIIATATMIEDGLKVKTGWFPEVKIERGKSGDKAGDYFYNKLRREIEEYLQKKRKGNEDE